MRDLLYLAGGGAALGTGHLRRSAEIISVLKDSGLAVETVAVLSVENDHRVLAPVTEFYQRTILLAELGNLKPGGAVVVDVPEIFQEGVAQFFGCRGGIVAALDWYREEADFECFNLRGGAKALRNAVIRREFLPYMDRGYEDGRKGVVLVTGGTDPLGEWGKIAQQAAGFARRSGERVVFAKGAGVELPPDLQLDGLQLLEDQRLLPESMTGARIAISNAGTGLLELTALGIPSVIFPQSPQERSFAEAFVDMGGAWLRPEALEDLEFMLDKLLGDLEEIRRRSVLCRKLVDAKGTHRIARAVERKVREFERGK